MHKPSSQEPGLDFPEIPADLIAQSPLAERDQARLMVLDRKAQGVRHARFYQLEELFRPGDVLALNDVKVFPARLTGRKATGGQVKLLLLKCLGPAGGGERWVSLVSPTPRLGMVFSFAEDVTARVEALQPSGEYQVLFSRPVHGDLERLGKMPLPPYIRRPGDLSTEEQDRRFYQTVYAKDAPPPGEPAQPWTPGAVAAPTAGLHFTEELLQRIRSRGVEVVSVRLKVGWGTFRPLRGPDYRDHQMLPEEFTVPEPAAEAINRARGQRGRLWAVGTTVVRTLESVADEEGRLRAGSGETSLYIHPGYRFRAVDALVTNFHLPQHTPLLLAAAFAGAERLRQAYGAAVQEKYRFFSYGDAMAIL